MYNKNFLIPLIIHSFSLQDIQLFQTNNIYYNYYIYITINIPNINIKDYYNSIQLVTYITLI